MFLSHSYSTFLSNLHFFLCCGCNERKRIFSLGKRKWKNKRNGGGNVITSGSWKGNELCEMLQNDWEGAGRAEFKYYSIYFVIVRYIRVKRLRLYRSSILPMLLRKGSSAVVLIFSLYCFIFDFICLCCCVFSIVFHCYLNKYQI